MLYGAEVTVCFQINTKHKYSVGRMSISFKPVSARNQ